MAGLTGKQMQDLAKQKAYEREASGRRDRGYTPGNRNIDPRRLSLAEKLIRNFENMPEFAQKDWYSNPRNKKKLLDAYMLVETLEPPAEPEKTGSSPNLFNPQGPDPTGPGGALEIPAHIRPDEPPTQGPQPQITIPMPYSPSWPPPALPSPEGPAPEMDNMAPGYNVPKPRDKFNEYLRGLGLSGDPRTGVLF